MATTVKPIVMIDASNDEPGHHATSFGVDGAHFQPLSQIEVSVSAASVRDVNKRAEVGMDGRFSVSGAFARRLTLGSAVNVTVTTADHRSFDASTSVIGP